QRDGLAGHHPALRLRLAARLAPRARRAWRRRRPGARLRAGRLAAAAAGETGRGAERALGEHACVGGVLGVGTEAVRPSGALKAHEDKHDDAADEGYQCEKDEPARLVLIVE